LDLDYFDFRAAKFGDNRDPLTPDISPREYSGRLATEFQMRLLEVIYWKNYVHTEGTEAKVQTVGWQWELGLRITDQISAFYEHHSRHRLDTSNPDLDQNLKPRKFPVEDSYGIRLRIYETDKPTRSIFH
jgi:hypothetical protein